MRLQLLNLTGHSVVMRRRFAWRIRRVRYFAAVHDSHDVRLRDMHGADAGREHGVHAVVDALDFALDAATVLELNRRSGQYARGEAEQSSGEVGFEKHFHRRHPWGIVSRHPTPREEDEMRGASRSLDVPRRTSAGPRESGDQRRPTGGLKVARAMVVKNA